MSEEFELELRDEIAINIAVAIRSRTQIIEHREEIFTALSSKAVATISVSDADAILAELAKARKRPPRAKTESTPGPASTSQAGPPLPPPMAEGQAPGVTTTVPIAAPAATTTAAPAAASTTVQPQVHFVGDSCPGRHVKPKQLWANAKSLVCAFVEAVNPQAMEKVQVTLRDCASGRLIYSPFSEMAPAGRWRPLKGTCVSPDCTTKAGGGKHPAVCAVHGSQDIDITIIVEWLRAWLKAGGEIPPDAE